MAVTKKRPVGRAKKIFNKNSYSSFDMSHYLTVHKQAAWLFNPFLATAAYEAIIQKTYLEILSYNIFPVNKYSTQWWEEFPHGLSQSDLINPCYSYS